MISTVWTKRDSAWRFYCPLFDILVLFFLLFCLCVCGLFFVLVLFVCFC